MTAYRYRALNPEGKLTKGILEGDSERQVRSSLRARQLRPVEVSEANRGSSVPSVGLSRLLTPRIKASELALMTRQLATLVLSNLPIDECLQAVADQTRKPRLKGLLLQVRSRVAEGHTLAYAMGEFPNVFNEMYRAMVKAGETAGFLGPVLEQLADYTEQRQHTSQQLQQAMIYPILLVVVGVVVVGILMTKVVPELVGLFSHTDKELPLLTQILIGTSDFFTHYALWMLVGVIAFLAGFSYLLRNERRRKVWHRVLLKVPGISGILRTVDTARFASTLSILMASGVPLLDSLRIAGAVLNNRVLRDSSAEVAELVQEGGSLHRAMQQSGEFPPMMVHMVASGETSGELENMLQRAAMNQERELQMVLGTLMSLLTPLMLIVMAVLVTGIVFGVMQPIFELNTMVK